jgi:DNA polymerase-1
MSSTTSQPESTSNLPLIFDLEADGLLDTITRIWCVTIQEGESVIHYGPDKIEEAVRRLHDRHIIGHNIIAYDIPAIVKFFPWFEPSAMDDTFILSSLFEPDRLGHGLVSWGKQFGIPKVEHEDWTQYSSEMRQRNIVDVQITDKVFNHLQLERNSGWDWEEAIELEYAIAKVHAKQEANGVYFDRRAAIDLKEHLDSEIENLSQKIVKEIPRILSAQGEPVSKPFKKDGTYSRQVIEWYEDTQPISGPFTRIVYDPINLDSHTQVKEYLLSQGWIPTEFTDKGSPKLTEDSFSSITGEIPSLLAKRNVLVHRGRLLQNTNRGGEEKGLINLIRKDGRITAGGVPQGTPTGRYRHSGVVNIPRVGSILGKEIRALFIPKPGYLFLGCDAKALEARMEAHYCYGYTGGKEYAKELLEGDLHTRNAEAFKCTRDVAKTMKYAISYGAQPAKLAHTLKCSQTKARQLFDSFWRHSKALAELKKEVTQQWNSRGGKNGGYLRGLDGRKLYARSEHSLVNLLFQSAGSIIVKYTTIELDRAVVCKGLRAKQVLHFHDEFQYEVHPKDVDRLKEFALTCFNLAGKAFNMNVPIEGDAKVGKSWGETH